MIPQASGVPTDEWERCKDWIDSALDHDGGHYSLDEVLAEILAERAHFWPGTHAAAVTQFWFFPKLKAINVWLAGGSDPHELGRMLPVIEAFGLLHGCTQSLIFGRRGWGKPLKARGYAELFTGFAKTLELPIGRC